MRTSTFTPEQVVHILWPAESGMPIAGFCRQQPISRRRPTGGRYRVTRALV